MACTLFFIIPLLYSKSYKNLYYAYTNKRLIVLSGAIGVDYRTLDYKFITLTSVDVWLLDKSKLHPTGTLCFKSPTSSIEFRYVEKPYDLMREIKDYINTANAD